MRKRPERGCRSVREASSKGQECQNNEDGVANLHSRDGREPGKSLFRAPSFGILRKITDDVRRRSFIWEIPDYREKDPFASFHTKGFTTPQNSVQAKILDFAQKRAKSSTGVSSFRFEVNPVGRRCNAPAGRVSGVEENLLPAPILPHSPVSRFHIAGESMAVHQYRGSHPITHCLPKIDEPLHVASEVMGNLNQLLR